MANELTEGTISTDELMKSIEKLEALAKGQDADDDPDDKDNDVDDDLDDKDPDDDPDEDDETEKSLAAEAGKAAQSIIGESEDIQKAIEVSDFLAELVYGIGNRLDELEKAIHSRINDMEKSLGEMGGAMAISIRGGMEQASLGVEDLRKSLAQVVEAPAYRRRSVATVMEKSFNPGAGPAENTLSKSQVLSRMTAMVEGGKSGVTPQDVVRFESSGHLSPAVQALVMG